MTEEQRKLLHSFPDKDRGVFNIDDQLPTMIPGFVRPIEDPLEAATLKAKIKQQKMRAAKLEREAAK